MSIPLLICSELCSQLQMAPTPPATEDEKQSLDGECWPVCLCGLCVWEIEFEFACMYMLHASSLTMQHPHVLLPSLAAEMQLYARLMQLVLTPDTVKAWSVPALKEVHHILQTVAQTEGVHQQTVLPQQCDDIIAVISDELKSRKE
jgi:hypothetical protein